MLIVNTGVYRSLLCGMLLNPARLFSAVHACQSISTVRVYSRPLFTAYNTSLHSVSGLPVSVCCGLLNITAEMHLLLPFFCMFASFSSAVSSTIALIN
jgi:hypothetical protein